MYALKSAQRLARAVRVEWEDGLSAQFTYVWLRDNGYKRPSLLHLDLNAKPQEVDYTNGDLNVLWPPFLPAKYSSQFLREHSSVKLQKIICPASKKVLQAPWRIQPRPKFEDYGHMASVQWGERAIECGTVWAHLERVPSIVAVESLSGVSKIHVVDAIQAANSMARSHPVQFAFLASSPVEYELGFFKAAHRTIEVQDDEVIAAVFNNDLRSSEITTNYLDMFYESLKTFTRICCQHMTTVHLGPEDLLVIDNSQTFIGAPAQAGRNLNLRLYH